jgi:hypothetical protein
MRRRKWHVLHLAALLTEDVRGQLLRSQMPYLCFVNRQQNVALQDISAWGLMLRYESAFAASRLKIGGLEGGKFNDGNISRKREILGEREGGREGRREGERQGERRKKREKVRERCYEIAKQSKIIDIL